METKSYNVTVTEAIVAEMTVGGIVDAIADYDFVTSAYKVSSTTVRVRVLAEMSSYYEQVLRRNNFVQSFVEVTK